MLRQLELEKILVEKLIQNNCVFIGIIIIFFDPQLANNFLGLFFASLMALSFGLAQVYSRELRNLDISLLNAYVALIGLSIEKKNEIRIKKVYKICW